MELRTKAKFAAVALIAMDPSRIGIGQRGRRCIRGNRLLNQEIARPEPRCPQIGVTCQSVHVEDAYWTDQPLTLTAFFPRLNSSIKSLRNGAPALPPPPNIWLMTRSADDCPNVEIALATRSEY